MARIRPARRCSAQRTHGRGPCRRWAILGGTVCPTHGGSAPQVRAAAADTWETERQLLRLERRVLDRLAAENPDLTRDELRELPEYRVELILATLAV